MNASSRLCPWAKEKTRENLVAALDREAMKARLLGFMIIGLAELHAQMVDVVLAPNQVSDLFGGRKHDLALVVYVARQERLELKATFFQIAGKLVAPMPQPEEKPLVVEGGDGIKRMAVFPVELPKVERKTQFLVRFEGAGALRLTVYPEDLLQPLRDFAEKDVQLFTLTSAGDLASFLRREKIHATEIGASVPPEFSERGIIFARKVSDEPQAWPTTLHEGQALVVFYPPEADELPRIVATPLARGIVIQVRMKLIEKMPPGPRAQEAFAELINLVRTLLDPVHPTPTP